MSASETATQSVNPLDFIYISNAAAASYNSVAPIDMSKYGRAYYEIFTGLFTASGTLDARLQSCQYSSFNTAVHNLATTNIAQMVNTAPNTVSTMEVRADQVVVANAADRYVRLNTTVGTAAVNYCAVGHGLDAKQKPGSGNVNTTIVVNQAVSTQ